MRIQLPVVAIAVGAGSGCALPLRDNPSDPALAPAARLAIVSMEPCTEVEPATGWPIVATASRGACLALDAGGTEDPQGDSLSFTYFFADSAGQAIAVIAEDVEEDFVPIPASLLRAQDTGVLVRLGVTATDTTGAKGSAFAVVVLSNSPPFVPEPIPRLLPEGGFPWARGEPMNIDLDGSAATDPDRDTPNFCWSMPETPLDACEFEGPVWSRSIAPDAERHLFHLEVHDGVLRSEKRTFVVRVGPPPLWDGGVGLRRFDETLRLWPKPSGTRPWFGHGADGEEWLLLYDEGDRTVTVHRWPELTSTGLTIALDPQFADLGIATPLPGGGMRIWIAARVDTSSTDLKAYDLDANGLSLTLVGSQTVSFVSARVLAADPAGNVVIGGAGGPGNPSVLEFVSADAATTWTVPLLDGTTVEGGGVIPGTSIFALSASGGLGDRILVYEIGTQGPVLLQEIDGLGPVRQLEFVDNDRFWAVIPSMGLTLFERNSLTPLAIVPDILEVNGFLRVDGGTGTCHLATSSSLVTVDVEGRETRYPLDLGSPAVQFVDSDGEVGRDAIGVDVLRISRTLDSEALVSVIDFQPGNPQRSIDDGGVWAVTSAPAIVHLSEDGTTLEYITELNVDGGAVPLIEPYGVVDPDGRGGWFTDFGASEILYRVDFEAERVIPSRVEAVAIATDLGFYPIGASSPTAAVPFAWMWQPGSNPQYGTIDELGNFDVWLSLTGESMLGDTGATVSHRSDDLCVFSQVGATSTLNHRRVSPAGVVTAATAVLVTSGQMVLRSPFTFPEPDTCGVVAGKTVTHVYVWDSAASLVATHFDADQLESVTAAGDGIYWGSGSLDGLPDRILTRMVQDTSGAFVRETFPVSLPNTPVFLP